MRIVTIIGARPQFIKASSVSRAILQYNELNKHERIDDIIVHTGQHYDENMSKIFFEQLNIPKPVVNLGINGSNHGEMTGRMLEKLEKTLLNFKPDLVLIYGDTNSTLAGALAAVKLHIPIAHVEAGLRSYNMKMPEEINRVLTDRISTLLFCPTSHAVENLKKEGSSTGVFNVGDVMLDSTLYYKKMAIKQYPLSNWGVRDKKYALCTVHRAENTNSTDRLANIFEALQEVNKKTEVIIPLHPRTQNYLRKTGLDTLLTGLKVIRPISFLEMVCLEASAKAILTDSGGVQKEAFFHRVPCITLRDETEWVETVESGWNVLCGADKVKISMAWDTLVDNKKRCLNRPYGDGKASQRIVEILVKYSS
jgi:UDP-GlcNAc3NAcA epimerase